MPPTAVHLQAKVTGVVFVIEMQRWRLLVAVMALAVIVVGCGVEPGESGDEPGSTVSSVPVSTTAEPWSTTVGTVAVDLVDGVTGILVTRGPDGEGHTAFWVDASGSYRYGDSADTDVLAYDASSLLSWVTVGPFHALNVGHPPSGPDSKTVDPTADSGVWLEGLRRSRAGGGDDLSWTSIVRGDVEFGEPDQIECTYSVRLDPETRLLMAGCIECGDRSPVFYEVVDFNPVARIDPTLFLPPADVDRVVSDQGFRHVTLDEATSLVGYRLPIPTLPPGYVLSTVVYSPHAAQSHLEAWDMPSFDVVVIVFRDGFQTVTVTTRTHIATREAGGLGTVSVVWDPWLTKEFGLRTVTRQGMIDGAPVSFTLIDGTSRAWAVTAEVVITVEGALSDSELDDVRNSFTTR